MAGTLVAYGSTLRKRYGRWAQKVSSAVVDQGLFAGGNLIVNILLARWMRPEQYGAFVVAYSWFLLPQNLYEAILIEPLSIFGSGKYTKKFKDYLGITFYGHVVVTAIMAICLGAAAVAARFFDSDIVAAAIGGAAIALPFHLTRWLTRRPFYVLSRPHWSAVGSFIYLILVVPGLFLLRRGNLLSPLNAMLVMALAALLTSIFLTFYLLKPQWNLKKTTLSIREVVQDHLSYSKWSTASRILAWIINNIYFIVLPIMLGLEGSGALRALTNFVMPILMIKVALTTMLLPSFVRAFTNHGTERLKAQVNRVLVVGVGLSAVYCLALVLFGRPLMSLFYYTKYDQYFTLPVLFTMGLIPILNILNAIIDAALRSMGGVKRAFQSKVLPAIAASTIGIVLIVNLGVLGANIGAILTEIITLVTLLYFYRSLLREPRAQTIPEAVISQPAAVAATAEEHAAEINGANGATPHKKVLLSAYACKPGVGSEGGTGWNVVKHTSQDTPTWVITREDRRQDIENELLKNPLPNVHWIYYDLPLWMRFWRKGRKGQRLHYYLWQVGAYLKMRQICKSIGIDVVHHISYKKYWNPSFLALLPAPFIWGPVGGGESMPGAFYPTLDSAGRRYEYARDLSRRIGELDPFVHLTAHRTRVALATTPESAAAMYRLGVKDVRVLPGIALDREEMQRLNALPPRNGEATFRLLSVGWLLGWKGFHLGLQAFARLWDRLPNAEYWIIGDGPQQKQLKSLAETLGIKDQVRFLGQLPRNEVFTRLADCDVLVHPSLHDSGGWVCLEAMAAGRPVLCLDIAGPRVIVTEETGFRVRAQTPEATITELSEKIYTLATDPDLRLRMAQAGQQRVAEHFCWDVKCKQYAHVYEEVVHQLRPQVQ